MQEHRSFKTLGVVGSDSASRVRGAKGEPPPEIFKLKDRNWCLLPTT